MIGNEYLRELFNYEDEDTSINQMLDIINSRDKKFISSLNTPDDLSKYTDEELEYVTKVSAIIDYKFQELGISVPSWLRDKKLAFDKPYYHSKRIDDFEKFKLMITLPGPFRARNVFFNLSGLERR